MRTDLLFEHFDALVKTPEDVAGLEAAILDLAVRGQLVPQDPHDEPAAELLKCIKAEKEQMLREKKIRKTKPLPPIEVDEIPYDLPKGWSWARLSEIGLINPRNEADDDVEASFVPMRLIPTEYGEAHASEKRLWGEIRSGYTHFQENDVVVAKITPCFHNRKSVVMGDLINGIGAGTTELFVFRGNPEYILPDYVLIFFKTLSFIEGGRRRMTGTAGQQRVPKSYVVEIPFPLPPLAEQKRIVARVDELLAQTRALAAQLEAADDALIPAAGAAFQSLTDAPNRAAQGEAWQRVSDAFDALTADPRTLDALKQTVLQLAVQGKLVPQDPDDEPASVLLENSLAARRANWEDQHPGKRFKEPVSPDTSDLPGLPHSWTWMTVEQACEKIVDCLHSTPKFRESGYMCVDTNSIRPGVIVLDKVRYVDEQTFHDRNRRMVPRTDDVMFSREGALLGIAVTVPPDIEFCLGQRMMIFRLGQHVNSKYYELVLNSPLFRTQYLPRISGSASPHLNIRDIRRLTVSLPPLAEQKRIVAKIESLLALCDALAEEVATAEEVRARLLQAVLNGE